jgi:hypothetical protein
MSEIGKTQRADAYQAKLEMQQREQLQQLKDKMRREIEGIVQHHERIKQDLETAYTVELSKEREMLDDKLADVRASNTERLANEKMAGEMAIEKAKTANQQHLAQVREDYEKAVNSLRKKYDMALQDMRRRYEKGTA